ncbi:MAG: hypothetical protein Crog4KO_36530 [Crocinitomicaceae bacterium]
MKSGLCFEHARPINVEDLAMVVEEEIYIVKEHREILAVTFDEKSPQEHSEDEVENIISES